MVLTVAKRVRRFDVACALESAFEHHDWKGDEHYKGVFFTSDKGYCVNKVLAIRIEHEEEAPDVFYSFAAESLDEKVMIDYPFCAMEMKPKKHHLLSERRELTRGELDELFDFPKESDCFVIENGEILSPLLERLPNKRERDRTQIHFTLNDNGCAVEIIRYRKHERDILEKKTLDLLEYAYEGRGSLLKVARLNANSLFTVLHLFPLKSEVSFYISRDRIKITGILSTLEGEKAAVEIVLAQMKG